MEAGDVEQIGSHKQCARGGCKVTKPGWRVILGHWRIQAYVCQRHLTWAAELDLLTESAGTAMGWAHGYPRNGVLYFGQASIVPEMPTVKRVNFARSVEVSASFPHKEMMTSQVDGRDFEFEINVYA